MATKRIILDARNAQTNESNDNLIWSQLDKVTMDYLRKDKKIKNCLTRRAVLKSFKTTLSAETKRLLTYGEMQIKSQAFGLRPNLFSRFIIQEIDDFGNWPVTAGKTGTVIPVLNYTLSLMIAALGKYNSPTGLKQLVIRDDLTHSPIFSGKFELYLTHLHAQSVFMINKIKPYTTECTVRKLIHELVASYTRQALKVKVNNPGTVEALQTLLDKDDSINHRDAYAAEVAKPFLEWDSLYTDCVTLSEQKLLERVLLFCHSQSKACATTVLWPALGVVQAIRDTVTHRSTYTERATNTLSVLHSLYLARLLSDYFYYSIDQLSRNCDIMMTNTYSTMTCLWPKDNPTYKAMAMNEFLRSNTNISRELYLPGKNFSLKQRESKECVLMHVIKSFFSLEIVQVNTALPTCRPLTTRTTER